MRHNHFKEEWCSKYRFKGWLARSDLKDSAKCNLCNKHFLIANAEISEIDSHHKGKQHRELKVIVNHVQNSHLKIQKK